MTDDITMASRRGRLILLACVLSSGAVFLDGTVVNIALFRIGDDLGAGFSTLQWVVDAYLLALCALVLIGGSLGDLFGRRRIFITGIACSPLTSAACGLAQTGTQLVVFRALQGVAGALVTPGSLSIVNSVFSQKERGKAIGTPDRTHQRRDRRRPVHRRLARRPRPERLAATCSSSTCRSARARSRSRASRSRTCRRRVATASGSCRSSTCPARCCRPSVCCW